MATTTIPKQHYVTIQYRKDSSTEDGHLGFASPYTKDAAFKKRKDTQDRWAYGGAQVTIDANDDITVSGSGRQGGYGHMEVDSATLFMTNCYPIIINNDLVDGFQIAKSVKRGGGWNSSGNVVWRIADPRGFELEISSSNFAAVLCCTTMVNGVIQGKCLWGRNGKDNILLPEASDVYQEAARITAKVEKKVSLKELQIGDTIEVLNENSVEKEDRVCQYLGKYFFLMSASGATDDYGYSNVFQFNKKQLERYLFKSKASGKYFALSTPKVVDIIEKIVTPLDKMEIAKDATEVLGRETTDYDLCSLILISPTKIKPEAVTTTLIPLPDEEKPTGGMWSETKRYYSSLDMIICELDGTFYMPSKERGPGSYEEKVPTLTQISVGKITENQLSIDGRLVSSGYSSWSRREQFERFIRKDFKFEDLMMFRAVVTANGITGKVIRL